MIDIQASELRSLLNEGKSFNFYDVREEWEHDEKNIGATCLPLPSIPERIEEISHLQNEEIIVHCKTGSRGNQAKKFLISKGFTNVRNLEGGIEGYLD